MQPRNPVMKWPIWEILAQHGFARISMYVCEKKKDRSSERKCFLFEVRCDQLCISVNWPAIALVQIKTEQKQLKRLYLQTPIFTVFTHVCEFWHGWHAWCAIIGLSLQIRAVCHDGCKTSFSSVFQNYTTDERSLLKVNRKPHSQPILLCLYPKIMLK